MLVLDLLVIGLAITLEPIPLTAFLLLVVSTSGVRKGAAFLFGWFASLAVVVAGTLVATGNRPPAPSSAPSVASLAVKLAVGVALVLVAVRQRRRMARPKKPRRTPRWQAGVDDVSPWFALALGPLVQPWGLVASGVAVVVNAGLESWASGVALLLFCVVASGVYLVLELTAAFRPAWTRERIAHLRSWIDSHTDQAIVAVSLVAGSYLVARSISGLVD